MKSDVVLYRTSLVTDADSEPERSEQRQHIDN